MTFHPKQFLEHVVQPVCLQICQELAHVHVALSVAVRVEGDLTKPGNLPESSYLLGCLHLPPATGNGLPVPAPQGIVELPSVPHSSLHAHDPWLAGKTEPSQLQLAGQSQDVPALGLAVDVVHVQPRATKV